MADGEYSTKLSAAARRRLQQLAEAGRVSPEQLAVLMLERHLFDPANYDWGSDPSDDPRTAKIPDYDPLEPTFSHEEVMAAFNAELERRLAARP